MDNCKGNGKWCRSQPVAHIYSRGPPHLKDPWANWAPKHPGLHTGCPKQLQSKGLWEGCRARTVDNSRLYMYVRTSGFFWYLSHVCTCVYILEYYSKNYSKFIGSSLNHYLAKIFFQKCYSKKYSSRSDDPWNNLYIYIYILRADDMGICWANEIGVRGHNVQVISQQTRLPSVVHSRMT